MNRLTALLLALVFWAGIYLPGLGSTELKGEEGRRIMPAVTMLEDGDWIVLHVGGEPFLRKPPLVQWCLAASFKLFGQNVWAARLPSVLGVLALAATIVLATRRWLISEQSLLAAVIVMTQIAIIDKCRLAELEAIYIALSGMAMVCWMSWWARGDSPWRFWVIPMLLNGLAFLAKGPLHLLFFYTVVVGALWQAGKLRQLWSRPHLAGFLLAAAVVLAWGIPYRQRVDAGQLAETLNNQMVQRFLDAKLDKWLLSLPSGIADHLPWIFFAPLLWRLGALQGLHEPTAALLRGGRWAVAGCFVVLLLVPGFLPRYILPLTTAFSVLLALVMWECPEAFRKWWRRSVVGLTVLIFLAALASPFALASAMGRGAPTVNPGVAVAILLPIFSASLWLVSLRLRLNEVLHLTLSSAMAFVLAMVLYALCVMPWMQLQDDLRPFARKIDETLPQGEKLIAYSVGDYAPLLAVLFYLPRPHAYAADEKSAPEGEAYYLVRGKDRAKFGKKFRIFGEPLAVMEGKEGENPAVVVHASKAAADRPTRE